MKRDFNKIVEELRNDAKEMHFLLLIEGAEAHEECDLSFIMQQVANPVIGALPCPLPGAKFEKINLKFSTGTTGLRPSYSYYLFANKDMCLLAQEKLSSKGYSPVYVSLDYETSSGPAFRPLPDQKLL